MWGVISAVPTGLLDMARMSMCLNLRKRALKKKAATGKDK